ncbi:MAG: hypothetical protein WCJ24_01255 [Candidatus Saccharibacteria bacterium]
MLDKLETKLNEVLVTKAPFQLPENWRKWLGKYAWVFALVGLIFGIFTVMELLAILGLTGAIVGAAGHIDLLLIVWISFLIQVGYVVLLAVATPKLKRMEKSGWNLIFYSNIFFLAYDVFNWIRNISFGSISGLVLEVLMAVVGLYFVFQIRSQFVHKATAHKTKKDKK